VRARRSSPERFSPRPSRDLALLRSLGADRRWITRAVHWQASSFSLVPVALGVPLGMIAGRLVFRVFADSLGAVPSASLPYTLLAGVVVAIVLLANVVAVVPAHRARRLAPAPLLTTE
jgi:putative ABC transport system permease protein